MQQRRGTAAQWTSADPVLNAGEMGWNQIQINLKSVMVQITGLT